MSDLLIRGMEMPRQGLKVVAIHSNGHVYADTSDPGFLHKIADVIELPPHGDLISRDQAFQMMLDRGYQKEAAGVILEVPTVIPSNKEETK